MFDTGFVPGPPIQAAAVPATRPESEYDRLEKWTRHTIPSLEHFSGSGQDRRSCPSDKDRQSESSKIVTSYALLRNQIVPQLSQPSWCRCIRIRALRV